MVQVFFIPSSSMAPTLSVDDRIVVEKVAYRFREPERGDVIVFAGQRRPAPSEDEDGTIGRAVRWLGQASGLIPPDPSDLVKRLVGLPGEEVAITGGLLYVDGVPLSEPYLTGPVASDYGPVTVPEDAYFFLGDNRRNSADSRGSLGFVERDRVIGRAVAVVWPFSSLAALTGQRLEPIAELETPRSSVG